MVTRNQKLKLMYAYDTYKYKYTYYILSDLNLIWQLNKIVLIKIYFSL